MNKLSVIYSTDKLPPIAISPLGSVSARLSFGNSELFSSSQKEGGISLTLYRPRIISLAIYKASMLRASVKSSL